MTKLILMELKSYPKVKTFSQVNLSLDLVLFFTSVETLHELVQLEYRQSLATKEVKIFKL